MKILKTLWVISLIIALFFTGCSLFGLLPIKDLEFEYYGMIFISLLFPENIIVNDSFDHGSGYWSN